MLPYPHHCRFPSRSPLFKLEWLVAWKACIMGHTPLNMHAGHVRPVYPVHVYPYQWYGTLLQQISAAISASLLFYITKPLFKLALLVAWKACIMNHTPLNMHAGHVRPVYPAPLCPYQSYGTLLQWISSAISASLPLSSLKPLVQASVACCMEIVLYGS